LPLSARTARCRRSCALGDLGGSGLRRWHADGGSTRRALPPGREIEGSRLGRHSKLRAFPRAAGRGWHAAAGRCSRRSDVTRTSTLAAGRRGARTSRTTNNEAGARPLATSPPGVTAPLKLRGALRPPRAAGFFDELRRKSGTRSLLQGAITCSAAGVSPRRLIIFIARVAFLVMYDFEDLPALARGPAEEAEDKVSEDERALPGRGYGRRSSRTPKACSDRHRCDLAPIQAWGAPRRSSSLGETSSSRSTALPATGWSPCLESRRKRAGARRSRLPRERRKLPVSPRGGWAGGQPSLR